MVAFNVRLNRSQLGKFGQGILWQGMAGISMGFPGGFLVGFQGHLFWVG
jgi:hypothetical protein